MISSLSLLRFAFLGIVLVSGKVAFDPNLGKASPYVFPEQVLLNQFSFVGRQAVETKSLSEYWADLKGYEYSYQKEKQAFKVKVHYLPAADGDLALYLSSYGINQQKVKAKPTQQQGQTGFYHLFEHERTAYLSSCINPKGSSTVTREQFFANRNAYDLKPDRLIPIILGVEDLRDARCLWVTISTPIENQSIQEVHQQLESVWREVYAWWMPNFPKL